MNITQAGIWSHHKRLNQTNNNKLTSPAHSTKHGERNRNNSFYITLAPSPVCSDDSDGSYSYDSIHARETDECRDTSDTESGGSSDQMEILEYEVASSSDSDNFYTNISSSGTDDDFVIAAILNGASTTNDSSDSGDISFFTEDSEDSSSKSDPELGHADYWECVKCKNKKNSPMYRFCERCFQLRKSLFPPPPTRKRSRSEYLANQQLKKQSSIVAERYTSSLKRRRSGTPNSVSSNNSPSPKRRATDKGDNLPFSTQQQQPTQRKRLHKKKNSAGESSDSDSDSDQDFNCTVKNRIGFLNSISLRSACRRRSSVKSKSLSEGSTFTNSNSVKKNEDDNTGALKQGHTSFNKADQPTSSLTAQSSSTNNLNSSLGAVMASTSRKRASSERDSVTKNAKLELMINSVDIEQPETSMAHTAGSSGKLTNKFLENVLNATSGGDTDSSDSAQRLKNLPIAFTKDSGFSSCSSQDLGSPISQEIDSAAFCDSQETCSNELGDDNVAKQETLASDQVTLLEQLMSQKNLFPSSLSRNSSSLPDYAFPGSSQNSEPTAVGSQSSDDITKTDLGLCMVCLVNPKDGGFVHKRKVHLCCCYKCANLIWKQRKTCPICNGKVMTVMKVFAH